MEGLYIGNCVVRIEGLEKYVNKRVEGVVRFRSFCLVYYNGECIVMRTLWWILIKEMVNIYEIVDGEKNSLKIFCLVF